jgi:hypothetical protein
MATKEYHVILNDEEHSHLEKAARSNKNSLRERTRARILLLADANREGGPCKDEFICDKAHASASTVARVRQRFAQSGLEAALNHKAQENRAPRKLDGAGEAHLIALVCGAPPEGHKRWHLFLLKDKLIEMQIVDSLSHETVRATLKKTNLSLG